MNETDQFLKDLEVDENADPFAAPEPVKEEDAVAEDPEEAPEDIKNRRHRRLEEKLQKEREANIALNARLSAIAEAKKEVDSPEYLKTVERIYGTDSPEALAATELLKTALSAVKEDAKREALEAYQGERRKEAEQEQEATAQLDSMLEAIEDEQGVDLTSPAAETKRRGFLKMLETMSPKDADGNIIAYADPHAVWEVYKERTKKPDSRAKDLAARGQVNSGNSAGSTLEDDTTLRFLKENGLI